jgi:hypothetical protein
MEEPIGDRDKSVRSMRSTGTAVLLHTLNTDPADATCRDITAGDVQCPNGISTSKLIKRP